MFDLADHVGIGADWDGDLQEVSSVDYFEYWLDQLTQEDVLTLAQLEFGRDEIPLHGKDDHAGNEPEECEPSENARPNEATERKCQVLRCSHLKYVCGFLMWIIDIQLKLVFDILNLDIVFFVAFLFSFAATRFAADRANDKQQSSDS